jgi:hypothetical protein
MPPSRIYDALTVVYTAAQVLQRAAVISIERKLPPAAYAPLSRTQPGSAQSSNSSLSDSTTEQHLQDRIAPEGRLLKVSEHWETGKNIKPDTRTDVLPSSNSPANVLSQAVPPPDSLSTPEISSRSELDTSYNTRAIKDDFDYYEDAEVCTTDFSEPETIQFFV